MKTIEASDQELQALLNLCHWACLQAGGDAANPAAVWQSKVREAKAPQAEELEAVTNLTPKTNVKRKR